MRHSEVAGGSTIGRLIACPGSREAQRNMVDSGNSFTREGSMLHDAAEMTLHDTPPLIGFKSHGVTFTAEHVPVLHAAIAAWQSLVDEYWISDYATEEEVAFDGELKGAFGSIDVLAKSPTHNIVLDWKFGHRSVDPVELPQGLFYAAACVRDPFVSDLFDVNKPTLIVIIQPHSPEVLKTWETDTPRLEAFIQTATQAVKASYQDGAERAPGSHCKYCKALPTCREYVDRATSLPVVEADKLGALLDLASTVELWVKAVRKAGAAEAEAGRVPAGYKVVSKRANRAWTDLADAEKALRGPGYRMKVVDICDRVLKSPAAIEKLLVGKKLPEGVVAKKSSGTALVPESDKRQAVLPLAKTLEAFSKLEN